ncbi:hypothetical protein OIV42_32645, partial [Burkholderia pseudomallei]
TTVSGVAGGFVGSNHWDATIADSESSGTVAGPLSDVGGFVGFNYGAIRSSHTSSMLDHSAGVTPFSNGGFVGFNLGHIESSDTSGAAAREPFAGVDAGWIQRQR